MLRMLKQNSKLSFTGGKYVNTNSVDTSTLNVPNICFPSHFILLLFYWIFYFIHIYFYIVPIRTYLEDNLENSKCIPPFRIILLSNADTMNMNQICKILPIFSFWLVTSQEAPYIFLSEQAWFLGWAQCCFQLVFLLFWAIPVNSLDHDMKRDVKNSLNKKP